MLSLNTRIKKTTSWYVSLIVFGIFIVLISSSTGTLIRSAEAASKTVDLTTKNWEISEPAPNREIEGYTNVDSAYPGDKVELHISSKSPSFSATVFRLGLYNGRGAARMFVLRNLHAKNETIPAANPNTGLVQPNWPTSATLKIPRNWPTGIYLIKLTNSAGYQRYIPLTIKDKKPKANIALIHTDFTDQAYNQWGGNSLYHGSTPALGITRGVTVALHRPFLDDNGSGLILRWEYPMIRFLDKKGYKVTYLTDSDVQTNPSILQQFKAVIVAGHSEYWTKETRDAYEAAISHGVNIAFFSANTSYRQIRLENQNIVGYKDSYEHDPLFNRDNSRLTTEFRNPLINRPESMMLGAAFGTQTNKAYPLVITNINHWVMANTGAKVGTSIPGIVGYECDQVVPDLPHPADLVTLTKSPVQTAKGKPDVCEATIYQAPSGAFVFNASTIQWSAGLDGWHARFPVSPIVQKMTDNLLQQFTK